ncbi:hypothetical protein ACSSV4_001402 [Roseovarius sp. MBR-154]|jgi:hypothetical protein
MLDDDVEVVLAASAGRRVIGVGSVAMLGLILLYLALVQSPTFGWQVFMVGFGTLALWLAQRMWRATTLRLELSPSGLRCSDGRMVAEMDEIIGVDRGAFAFKPSNGFMLKLSRKGAFAWEPGLWWRIGRRVGVGGVTPNTPAKVMAELMQDRINRRSAD